MGLNFSKHGGGRSDKRRGVGGRWEGVWANGEWGKVRGGGGLKLSRFRLRICRE